ncbi:MAG: sensor histidine kinase, partial [Terriglobales bacterium]
LNTDYAGLLALTEHKPELYSGVLASKKSLDEAGGMLLHFEDLIESGRTEELYANYDRDSDRLKTLFKNMVNEQIVIAAKSAREYADSSNKRQAFIRSQILNTALFASLGTMIFSIFLAIFFTRTVTSRLEAMTENTRRLAEGEPLRRRLYGDDEIAELDRVFHKMAGSLEEAARMKEELVAMLTHDLRSPLTAIKGSLEMLQVESDHQNERMQRLVNLAERNSVRMMSLIDDLLDIQKIKSGMMQIGMEQVCLAEIFEEVIGSVSDWIIEHDIHLNVQDTDLFVTGDHGKLTRVVFNLVSNAIKFSPSGGTIALSAKKSGDQIEVTVSDEGPGIPQDMLQAVFERFQQVDNNDTRAKGGSGLGLAVCQAIITLHGGAIWVTSEIGKGSVFHFTCLPG